MFLGEALRGRRSRPSLLADASVLELGYGRFMQTDPLGYEDGLNWYNYVGSDPLNQTDPSGMLMTCTGSIIPRADCTGVSFLYCMGSCTIEGPFEQAMRKEAELAAEAAQAKKPAPGQGTKSPLGPLTGTSREDAAAAAQINRLSTSTNVTISTNIDGSRLTITRNGSNVSGKIVGIQGTLSFTGKFSLVEGKREVRINSFRAQTSVGTLVSAPTQIRIFNNSKHNILFQFNRDVTVKTFIGSFTRYRASAFYELND